MCWSVITFAHALPCFRPWTTVCLPIIAVRTYPRSGGRLCPLLGLTVEAHYVLMTITLRKQIDVDHWDAGGLELPNSLSDHQIATGGIPALPVRETAGQKQRRVGQESMRSPGGRSSHLLECVVLLLLNPYLKPEPLLERSWSQGNPSRSVIHGPLVPLPTLTWARNGSVERSSLPPLLILFWGTKFGDLYLFDNPYFCHPKHGEASTGCLLNIAPTLTVLYARTRSTLMGVTTYVVPKNTT